MDLDELSEAYWKEFVKEQFTKGKMAPTTFDLVWSKEANLDQVSNREADAFKLHLSKRSLRRGLIKKLDEPGAISFDPKREYPEQWRDKIRRKLQLQKLGLQLKSITYRRPSDEKCSGILYGTGSQWGCWEAFFHYLDTHDNKLDLWLQFRPLEVGEACMEVPRADANVDESEKILPTSTRGTSKAASMSAKLPVCSDQNVAAESADTKKRQDRSHNASSRAASSKPTSSAAASSKPVSSKPTSTEATSPETPEFEISDKKSFADANRKRRHKELSRATASTKRIKLTRNYRAPYVEDAEDEGEPDDD